MSSLLRDCQRGERAAQHELYREFAPAVFGVCLRYARDAGEADDFAQEAWVQAFTKLGQYREDGPFGAWLRRLTVNVCLQELRRRRRHVDWADTEAAIAAGSGFGQLSPTAIAQLTADELLAHIQTLPEAHRLVFNLVAVEGYSHAEAAAALGIAESSSRSNLTRARHALQRRLAHLIAVCL